MTLNEARTAANIVTRSLTLWQDGYTWKPFQDQPALFLIYRPGSTINDYIVDSRNGFCSCKCNEARQFCKHSLAVKRLQEEQDAADAAWLEAEHRQAEEAECATGCDAYAEF